MSRKRMMIAGMLLLSMGLIANSGYIHAKALLAQLLIANAWQQTLESKRDVKPWSWADTWPVAKLTFSDSGDDLYVLSGATGAPLAFGPGHYRGTALPGEQGSSVIAGHRDTHFSLLKDVGNGSEIRVQRRDGKTRSYLVAGKQIVDSSKGEISIDRYRDELKLVTCYPFDAVNPGGPLRMVVTARPVKGA
jgi:sortase A